MVGVAETGSGYLLPEMEKARGVESVYLPMGRELAGQGSSGQAEAPTDGVQSSYLLPGLGQPVAAAKTRSVFAMAELNSLGGAKEAAESPVAVSDQLPSGSVFVLEELNGTAATAAVGKTSVFLPLGAEQMAAGPAESEGEATVGRQLSSVFPVDGRSAFLLPAPCQDLLSNFLLPTINA